MDEIKLTIKLPPVTKKNSMQIVVSTDGSRVMYDKENPRTEVTITKSKEELPW